MQSAVNYVTAGSYCVFRTVGASVPLHLIGYHTAEAPLLCSTPDPFEPYVRRTARKGKSTPVAALTAAAPAVPRRTHKTDPKALPPFPVPDTTKADIVVTVAGLVVVTVRRPEGPRIVVEGPAPDAVAVRPGAQPYYQLILAEAGHRRIPVAGIQTRKTDAPAIPTYSRARHGRARPEPCGSHHPMKSSPSHNPVAFLASPAGIGPRSDAPPAAGPEKSASPGA
jgi:hypothetical protein